MITVKAARRHAHLPASDVATVQIGGDFRRGALDVNGHEVVGGTVVMRTGENAQGRDRAREGEDRADSRRACRPA